MRGPEGLVSPNYGKAVILISAVVFPQTPLKFGILGDRGEKKQMKPRFLIRPTKRLKMNFNIIGL